MKNPKTSPCGLMLRQQRSWKRWMMMNSLLVLSRIFKMLVMQISCFTFLYTAMENINHYNHRVSVSFNNFLQEDITLGQLIQELQKIESQIRRENFNGSLWFKFSQDDSLATTIADLRQDLSDVRNKEFTKRAYEGGNQSGE